MKELESAKVGAFIAWIVAFAMVLGMSCTRDPNPVDGIIQMEAVTGVVSVSPGDLEKIKEKIPTGGSRVSRSYLKANGKETVRVTGSGSNTAVFLSGTTPETAEFRIKGSKDRSQLNLTKSVNELCNFYRNDVLGVGMM